MKIEEFTDSNDFGLKYLDNSFVFPLFQATGEMELFFLIFLKILKKNDFFIMKNEKIWKYEILVLREISSLM